MSYINRENLLATAKEFQGKLFGAPLIVRAIEDAPAADVVEVVRCKDCKRFCKMDVSPSYDGKCLGYGFLVEAKHYCSYGEREAEE